MKQPVPNLTLVEALELQGHALIAGVDEVGRGCLAGPVVAAAVLLPSGLSIRSVRDSKLLAPSRRETLAIKIKQLALAVGVGWVSQIELDDHGLSWAVRQSGLRALENMNHAFDFVILDGNYNYLAGRHQSVAKIKADQTSLPVACASIVAKVARDRYMYKQSQLYPEFGFNTNVGYATAAHRRQLAHGITPLHRRSFKPVLQASYGG